MRTPSCASPGASPRTRASRRGLRSRRARRGRTSSSWPSATPPSPSRPKRSPRSSTGWSTSPASFGHKRGAGTPRRLLDSCASIPRAGAPVIHRLFPAVLLAAATLAAAQDLPKFPSKDVPETFFGTVVNDPYRGLENVKDPAVASWMKAHADHAKKTLEGLKGYATLKARVTELDNAVQARIGNVQRPPSGELFFTRRGQKDNTFKLFVRAKDGKETLLADPDDWQKDTGKPHAINYFAASPDGKHVAFGVSAAGSEDASIYVMEVATKKRVGKPIDRAQYPDVSWRDNGSFFFLRQQKMEAGMPATEKYQNNRSYLHIIGTDPEKDALIIGPGTTPKIDVPRTDFPYVLVPRGSK